MQPPQSIRIVAIMQTIGSLPFLYVTGETLWSVIRGYHLYPHAHQLLSPWVWAAVIYGPLCFALIAVVTSYGLLHHREWARKSTIFLSTVPLGSCAALMVLHPKSVFPPAVPNEQYAMLTVGSGIVNDAYTLILIVLIPVSFWWLILMTRPSVRASFGRKEGEAGRDRPTWIWAVMAIEALLVAGALVNGVSHW